MSRTRLVFLTAVLVSGASAAFAGDLSALDSLVSTERAFSTRSVEKGMRDAFLFFLADDGVVFNPLAANGKKTWGGRPPVAGTLVWEPSYAEVSAAGDLGYTTGPFEHRLLDQGSPVEHGHFVSLWKKQADGEWRVALDIDSAHERPERGVGGGDFTPGPEPASARMTASPEALGKVRAELHLIDREYSKAAASQGPAAAFAMRAAGDVRFYREGAFPVTGIEPARAELEKTAALVRWKLHGVGLARSADLGYTYGTVEHRDSGADTAPARSGVYLHLWRKSADGPWRLALDLEKPLPVPAEK